MTKEILIKKCILIIKEIEKYIEEIRMYYICRDSSIENVCEDIVPLLRSYGLNYVKGFRIDNEDMGAFRYHNIIVPDYGTENRVKYNRAKINHIRSFVAWLKAGNEVEQLFIKETE